VEATANKKVFYIVFEDPDGKNDILKF